MESTKMWKIWFKVVYIRFIQMLCGSVMHVLGVIGVKTPRHVAIIMDGNRRYARRGDLELEIGYRRGHETLMTIMKCCTMTCVRELTVYAFSIENFKRGEQEVGAIMQLAAEKFQQMLDELGEMHVWGVRVRIVGRQELLSAELRALGARAELATRHNDVLQLNIAFPYTGRDEISRAASCIVDGVKNAELSPEDVDEQLVTQVLEVGEPQLLVRTSGEVRLSDFLLWQVSKTVMYFTDTLWPEFSTADWLRALLHYWRHAPAGARAGQGAGEGEGQGGASHAGRGRTKMFLENVQRARWQRLQKFAA